ncbi:hypothetical protein [Catellatospora citrea]|uniref:Lipoprotein n=1 Tax=Catellatospora citrea TaxID=53366 RepID=A0A8J3P437_9ACTN|nr:hypothetical protein [Catellatospora citrea]RKE12044.1 hypothetical protein C8E86_6978 [Catellatospora citrea]GIG02987.1 hypothetical protein Cci01nite_80800 [Catellatospora citrea]
MENTRARWIARCALGVVVLAGAGGCATPPGQNAAGGLQPASQTAALTSPTPSPVVSPSAPSSPTPSAAATGGSPVVPRPDQAFLLQAVDRIEDPVLTVTASGRIGTYPGGADTGDRERFMLVPLSPGAKTYLLMTAQLRVGGEPWCAGIKAGVLHTVPCDAAASTQRVTVVARGKDASGAATFDLVIGGYQVEVSKDGKVSLKKQGGAPAGTRFRFVPAGTAGPRP